MATIGISPMRYGQNIGYPNVDTDEADGREVETMMAIRGGPGGYIHQPIHESLTLAALISGGSGTNPGTNADNASNQDWEYIRGAVWNDDPACLLFDDGPGDNHSYSMGLKWYYQFHKAESEWQNGRQGDMKNVTGRSHYGDLQFLHCMASKAGETPAETKRKFMVWLEVMYKLANGEDGITGDTVVDQTKLIEFCPLDSLPPSWMPLRYLLTKGSPFQAIDIQRRALGSMFHVIQDSYAVGHTRRVLLNPQDKLSENPLTFKPGTTDQWGEIQNFHTYDGQNDDLHSKYDHSQDKVPDPSNLGNLDQFNGMIGCRQAVEKCKKLMTLKQAGTKWSDGVEAFLDNEVFGISANATPANTQVWP